MEKSDINNILTTIFNNSDFIKSLFVGMYEYDSNEINRRLAIVLKYYLVTNDKNTDCTYLDIIRKYKKLNKNFSTSDVFINYIINSQYLTHAFNGHKRKNVSKHGFSYLNNLDIDEREHILRIRDALNNLESDLGISFFIDDYVYCADLQLTYLSSPGTKTFHYALGNSPERLYEGPMNQNGNEAPFIVGESKYSYTLRVLRNKIKEKFSGSSSGYKEAYEYAQMVAEEYCTLNPSFALVRIKDIIDDEVRSSFQGSFNSDTLGDKIKKGLKKYKKYDDFFSHESRDETEDNELDNIPLNSNEIPLEAISIVDVLDSFDIKQKFALEHGYKIGDVVSYKTCQYIRPANIEELIECIGGIDNDADMNLIYDRFSETFNSEKDNIKKWLIGIKLESYDKEIIKTIRSKLISKEDELLKKNADYDTVSHAFKSLSPEKRESLLNSDDEILNDNNQYRSELHGVSHTRRVNFLMHTLLNNKYLGLDASDERVLLAAVKYHDIGRTHDDEDDLHGTKSIEKLEGDSSLLDGFSEVERKEIMFIIKNHSLSTKENNRNLMMIDPKYRERYTKLLFILKDADKLDRVRLDPLGLDSGGGLDASRLSLRYSKTLESLAYASYNELFECINIEKKLHYINVIESFKRDMNFADEFLKKLEKKCREIVDNKVVLEESEIKF